MRKLRNTLAVVLAGLLAGVGVGVVSAQSVQPIILNENLVSTIVDSNEALVFQLDIDTPTEAVVQALALSNDLALRFDIVAPSGVVVADVDNTEEASTVSASVSLANGAYFIRVSSANDATGQFVLSVRPTSARVAPTRMPIGQVLAESVDAQTPLRSYTVTLQQPKAHIVSVQMPTTNAEGNGPTITLTDGATGETLAVSSARLNGARYRIPASQATGSYGIQLSYTGSGPAQAYNVCVGTEDATAPCPNTGSVAAATPVPTAVVNTFPTPLPTLPPVVIATATALISPNSQCQVTPLSAAQVNVRQGPGTNFNVVSSLILGRTAQVIGRLPDTSWYQVNNNGVLGWISTAVVSTGGQCGGVPIVQPPTPVPATPAPANVTATLPPPPQPNVPTATPNAPQISGVLNFNLPQAFGFVTRASGFTPDPYSIDLTAGGFVNPSYISPACTGNMTSEPTFSFNYTSGAFTLLRFYFVASGDTTMVINTPSNSYICNDDSFGTNNPTLDFQNPASGRYDIWIGTFNSGGFIDGKLFVTETSNNHP